MNIQINSLINTVKGEEILSVLGDVKESDIVGKYELGKNNARGDILRFLYKEYINHNKYTFPIPQKKAIHMTSIR